MPTVDFACLNPRGLFIGTISLRVGVRLVIAGELDIETAPTLKAKLDEVSQHASRVELDMSEVSFADSIGLHVLLKSRKDLGDRPLEIVAASRQVHRLLGVTGLERLFHLPDQPQDSDGDSLPAER